MEGLETKKSIFNVRVPMESQEQCDRMKQLCIENNLDIFETKKSFELQEIFTDFGYYSGYFSLWCLTHKRVTETEFIELLKQHNK